MSTDSLQVCCRLDFCTGTVKYRGITAGKPAGHRGNSGNRNSTYVNTVGAGKHFYK